MSVIPRASPKLSEHDDEDTNIKNNTSPKGAGRGSAKKTKRRTSLALQEAIDTDLTPRILDNDDANFFGFLPELDEQDILKCDEIANNSL